MGLETALLVGGTIMSAAGSLQQANAAAAASKYNARVAERNAEIAGAQGREEERRQRILSAKQIGSMKAGYGASGVSMEGSPLDVLEESAFNAEMDALNIQYNTKLKQMGYQADATLDRMNAKASKQAGIIGAGSSLLLGGSKIKASMA